MEPRIFTDKMSLLDLVHDRFFDLDEFTFDEQERKVSLYLGENSKGPYNEKLLMITDVSHVDIHDTEHIRIYDLCDVHISNTSIRLEGGVPIEIVLTVGERSEISILVLVLPRRMLDKQSKKEGGNSLLKRVRDWLE